MLNIKSTGAAVAAIMLAVAGFAVPGQAAQVRHNGSTLESGGSGDAMAGDSMMGTPMKKMKSRHKKHHGTM